MKKVLFIAGLFVTLTLQAQTDNLTFVFLNKRTDLPEMPKKQLDKLMEGHLANIERLAKEGKLKVAGPFEEGGGIFVLSTSSQDEAKQWLSTDPGVQAQRWNMEYHPMAFRIGGACAVGEKYEMVTYHFVRYGLNLTKFNVQESPNTLRRHEQYVKQLAQTGNVIAEASLGEKEGAILIMKGDLDQRAVEASPAVQEQLFEIEVKKIWVAKGSFCEGK
jgi:uncharacterized protein YciI